MQFFAHSKHTNDGSPAPKGEWEPLFTPFGGDPQTQCQGGKGSFCPKCDNLDAQHGHLNKVAHLAARFAGEMFPEGEQRETVRQWGYLAGLWHDLGKYSEAFQNYLEKSSDTHIDEILERIDHTTAGAKQAVSASPLGHLIATAIAGHHSGLLDARATGACLENRLRKRHGTKIPTITAPPETTDFAFPTLPNFLSAREGGNDRDHDFSLAFFQRLLFSCLVDADFLATEAFMNPMQATQRPRASDDIFPKALQLLKNKIADFGPRQTPVAHARTTVFADCTARAASPPGRFSLTVPTGGGKTLSSLNSALCHALKHGHQRIIYVQALICDA